MQSKQLLVILTTIITLIVNSLANIIPFNGQTSKQVSDKYFTTFTPAGYAFAIWSVIYIGLLAFTIYQALPSQKERFNKVRDWVIISNLAGQTVSTFHLDVGTNSLILNADLPAGIYQLQVRTTKAITRRMIARQ